MWQKDVYGLLTGAAERDVSSRRATRVQCLPAGKRSTTYLGYLPPPPLPPPSERPIDRSTTQWAPGREPRVGGPQRLTALIASVRRAPARHLPPPASEGHFPPDLSPSTSKRAQPNPVNPNQKKESILMYGCCNAHYVYIVGSMFEKKDVCNNSKKR